MRVGLKASYLLNYLVRILGVVVFGLLTAARPG
jgi:hypothetical protein